MGATVTDTITDVQKTTTSLVSQGNESDWVESNFSTTTFQLPSDYKKVVALVGASKAGTTFIAHAIACCSSEKGIRTALLDMTKSKGLYYLYNKSDTRKSRY